MFQCTAVRRTSSHEEFETPNKEPSDDLLSELASDAGFVDKDIDESHLPAYTDEVTCEENQFNKVTNKIAQGMYSYQDKSDYTYGRLPRLLILKRLSKILDNL